MENQTLQLAKQGNEEAINLLFEELKPLVKSIARKYFLINLEQSDLVQEGMIGLFNAIRSYDENSDVNFINYAKICVKRQIQNALIKNNRLKNQMLNTYFSINNQGKILLNTAEEGQIDDETGFYLESKTLSPEESLIFKEKLSEINLGTKKVLSHFEREVLKLYMKGLNYVEIAGILKKEPKSIDNALSRIKIKLRFLKGE